MRCWVLAAAWVLAGCGGRTELIETSGLDLCAQHGSEPFRVAEVGHAVHLSAGGIGLVWIQEQPASDDHSLVQLLRTPTGVPETVGGPANISSVVADRRTVWWVEDMGGKSTIRGLVPGGESRFIPTACGGWSGRLTQSRNLLAVQCIYDLSQYWQVIEKSTGTTLTSVVGNPSSVVVDDDALYFADFVDGELVVSSTALSPGAAPVRLWSTPHSTGAQLAIGGDTLVVSTYRHKGEPEAHDQFAYRLTKSGTVLAQSDRSIFRPILATADQAGILVASIHWTDSPGVPPEDLFYVDEQGTTTLVETYAGVAGVALTDSAMFWLAADGQDVQGLYMACRK